MFVIEILSIAGLIGMLAVIIIAVKHIKTPTILDYAFMAFMMMITIFAIIIVMFSDGDTVMTNVINFLFSEV